MYNCVCAVADFSFVRGLKSASKKCVPVSSSKARRPKRWQQGHSHELRSKPLSFSEQAEEVAFRGGVGVAVCGFLWVVEALVFKIKVRDNESFFLVAGIYAFLLCFLSYLLKYVVTPFGTRFKTELWNPLTMSEEIIGGLAHGLIGVLASNQAFHIYSHSNSKWTSEGLEMTEYGILTDTVFYSVSFFLFAKYLPT